MLLNLIKGIREQSVLSVSQAITLVENNQEEGRLLLSKIYQYTGNAYRIGITGPPGAGKSSITNSLISEYRKLSKRIAIIAVDPTSPFSGGAILGDRIRMTSHYLDSNVFVRSMATRGNQGGLALKANEIGDIFDAAGYDIIIYETVGVGQVEIDVIQSVDSVVVVLVPESGDEIQMMKAGLMEIGNIFCINKSDRPGANKLKITLNNVLTIMPVEKNHWLPEIVHTVATHNKGIKGLIDKINSHRFFDEEKGYYKKKINERYKHRITEIIKADYILKLWNKKNLSKLNKELDKNYKKRKSPYEMVKYIILDD